MQHEGERKGREGVVLGVVSSKLFCGKPPRAYAYILYTCGILYTWVVAESVYVVAESVYEIFLVYGPVKHGTGTGDRRDWSRTRDTRARSHAQMITQMIAQLADSVSG